VREDETGLSSLIEGKQNENNIKNNGIHCTLFIFISSYLSNFIIFFCSIKHI